MPAPVDPDAALHAAQPGKFKPAGVDAPPAPSEPGTLSDSVERLPNYAPVKATQAPMEPAQSWGDWLGSGWGGASSTFHAAVTASRNDRGDFGRIAMRDGYAPILDALGIDGTQNPELFNDAGTLKPPSSLYRKRNPNAGYFDYSNVSQAAQEQLIADEIRDRRAKDPKALPGVPDTVEGLHAFFIANEKKKRDQASASIAAQPRGLGTNLASLSGSLAEAGTDPFNVATLPLGGGGKTILGVVAREALVNGIVSAVQQPLVAHNREMFGEHLTAGEAAANIGLGAAGGAALGGALHVTGKAIAATGLPQKLASAVGNLDIANSVSYKIYSALPEAMQRKWGAGIVTKWGKRLAAGEKLDDVFSNLSNVELATLSKTVIGADRLTPEERAAAEHLTRTEEVGSSSPYEPGATGDGTHEEKLGEALDSIINNRPVGEVPSAPRPSDPGAAVASPADPARPPAALSTARRPLSPALEAARLPADIYDGLKTRGIPDHIARGIAAGSFAEARGSAVALNPTSGAFGIGQWLGSRKDELFRRYGPSPSLEQQLDFLVSELKGGDAGGKSVLAAKDEVDALHRYIGDFMRPAKGFETDRDLKSGMKALGRAGEDPGAIGDVAGGAADVGPDPDIARLREEALNLDDAVIGAPASAVPPMYARSFRPDEITVDAARFQFKSGGDTSGVTDRLRGVEQWNPMHAGRVVVWEDEAGRVFLADGHQRHGLATRIEAAGGKVDMDAIMLRHADGVSAEDARVYAAIKNIAEVEHPSKAQLVDAAKVARDAGVDHLLAHLPPRSPLVRDARALASLSDEAFGAVYNDVLPADYAAVIGHLLPDRPEAHGAMVDLLVKTDPANRGQAESIVRQGIAAGMHKESQVDLFGEREVMQSLMLERAKVLEKGLARLRNSKLLFKTAAKEADRLEAVGSKIAKSASEKEAQANAQALELVSRLAFTHGPIADALNEASRKLAAGAKLADVADEFAAAVKRTDLGTLAREAANDDANRLVPDGAGRGGDAAEAGEAVREEQPSLADLERATERFSDPDGPPVKQQAESLEHDLKAELDEKAAFERERNSIHTVGLAALLDGGDAGQIGGFHWRRETDADGEFFRIWKDGDEAHDIVADRAFLLDQGIAQARSGNLDPAIEAELGRILSAVTPIVRRERIKAASAALEGGKPGELRTVEPFPEEPGYHRFRYVAEDGTAVGGNYTLDNGPPPFLEGFNVGDTNNPTKLGAAEVRKLFAEIRRQHPEVTRIHAFRMTGARAVSGDGPKEIWIDLAGKGDGVKPEDVDVRAGEPVEDPHPAAAAAPLGEAKNVADQARAIAADLEPGKPEFGKGWSWGERSNLGNDVPKGGMVLDMPTPEGNREFIFNKRGELVDGPLGRAADREAAALDLGEKVDPAIADRQRQQVDLKAGSPLQSLEEQLGTIGLSLFDAADQPMLELHAEAKALLDELDADDKAIKALKDCL